MSAPDTATLVRALASGSGGDKEAGPVTSCHAGRSGVSFGALCDALRPVAHLVPRTGHIGDWRMIADCRAGALDFNAAVCSSGVGHASVHAFTLTETAETGDRIYRPATLFEDDRPVPLAKSTWDGRRFVTRGESSLVCSLVLVEHEGHRLPLVELHRRRLAELPCFRGKMEASVLLAQRDRLRAGLVALLTEAAAAGSRRATAQVIGRVYRLDGRPIKGPFDWTGGMLASAEATLGGPQDVADAAIAMLEAVDDPDRFFASIARQPSALPVLSPMAIMLFAAMFQTVRAGDISGRQVHFHWGARDMSGYPPDRPGYFVKRTYQQRLSRMARTIAKNDPQFAPLQIVLLPAPVFMLMPVDRAPRDTDALERLFAVVQGAAATDMDELAILVRHWFVKESTSLSAYFLGRFRHGSGMPTAARSVPPGISRKPEGMDALALSTLSVLVGLFHKQAAGEQ